MASLSEKKDLLHLKASKSIDTDMIHRYINFANDVITQYRTTLSHLSYLYEIRCLPKYLKDEAESMASDREFIGFLVDRVFQHDQIALNLYMFLYEEINPELVLTSGEIYSDNQLFKIYMERSGGGEDILAEMNGELWLQSDIGAAYLSDYME